jgi:hypothetical protein
VATGANRAAALIAVGALVAAWPVLGATAPAQAHNYVVSTTPEAGSTITELPESISVTTNEPLLTLGGSTGGFALEVRDSDGRYFGDGCVAVEGATMSTGAALGAAGEYTVLWQAVSADGHTVSDQFRFEWAPTPDAEPSTGSTTVPDCNGTTGGLAPGPDATAEASASEPADLGTVAWIGGAVVAVALTVGITLFVVGRRT